jgi:hypothetical protein
MKYFISVFLLLAAGKFSFSQEGISIGPGAPAASAVLDIKATNKGLLPPRVSLTGSTDVATIPSPATGLVVYNTATAGTAPNQVTPGYYYFTGVYWLAIGIKGNNPGDMQYWNGKQWVILPAGAHNDELSVCNAVPKWGACPGSSGLPAVSTSAVTSVIGVLANCGGTVTASGGSTVLKRGVCFGLAANPDLSNNVTYDDSSGLGSFTTIPVSVPAILAQNTTYHFRAFATNNTGTAYGADALFTTGAAGLPGVETIQPFGIGSTSAYSGVVITTPNGAPITISGIRYGPIGNPTQFSININDTFLSPGSVPLQMTSLLPNTIYNIRAYASNNGYTNATNGISFSFTTLPSGYFAALYPFDAVTTSSGLTDPGQVPVVNGLSFSACNAVSAGAPSLNPVSNGAFAFTGWSLGATNGSNNFLPGDTTAKYFQITVSPNPGKILNLTAVKFKWQRSGTGPRQVFVRSSIDNFASNLPAGISPANFNLSVVSANKFQMTDDTLEGQDGCTVTLSGPSYTAITTPVTFRIYGINAEDAAGVFSIDNLTFNGIVN